MKKIAFMLFATAIILTSCGGSDSTNEVPVTDSTSTAVDTTVCCAEVDTCAKADTTVVK